MMENWVKWIKRIFWRLRSLFQTTENYYIGGSDQLPSPLTAEEEAYYLANYTGAEEDIRQMLIERNLRLVVYIARKFENTGVGLEDLISIGTIGLIKAVNTYRADRNTKLATYGLLSTSAHILKTLKSGCISILFMNSKKGYNVEYLQAFPLMYPSYWYLQKPAQ